jgi:hypothetical protein
MNQGTSRRRVWVVGGLSVLLALSLAIFAVPTARGYGSTALWQVAMSINCDNPNPAICGGGGGGVWVWAEFDSTGGNATVTGCGHTGSGVLGLTPPFGGAGHTDVKILAWTIGTDGDFVVLGEVDTFVGHGTPVTVTVSPENFDTGVPAAPGHYSLSPAPGVSIQIQVAELH